MPTDPRKRQKKLEKRAAKRKEMKHLKARDQHLGLRGQIVVATKYPFLHCLLPTELKRLGICWVLVSRGLPNGTVVAASFLVDSYCLGVKNVHVELLPRSSYEDKYLRKLFRDMPSRNVEPAEARKFVEGAVAYARGLGLAPHPEYETALLIFGDVEASGSDAAFEYGKDGKPFFVSGPNDTPHRCRQIHAALTRSCGVGGFDYLMAISPEEAQLFVPDREMIEEASDDDEA